MSNVQNISTTFSLGYIWNGFKDQKALQQSTFLVSLQLPECSGHCTGGVCTLFCNVQYLLSFNPHDCSILFVQIKYCKNKPCVRHTAVMDRYSKLIAAKEISFFKQIGAKSYFEFHIFVRHCHYFLGENTQFVRN